MKLYIYDHCPYCTKARMIFGFHQLPVEIITLANDDEATPVGLVGKKMVPILETAPGVAMPESMDIVQRIEDQSTSPLLVGPHGNTTVLKWLEDATQFLYPLTMPRWVEAPLAEFATELSRRYFIKKKQAYIGSFAEHRANSAALIAQANAHLAKLETMIHSPKAIHGELSKDDIHLFATLRALSVVKGMVYGPKTEAYRQWMSAKSGVPLHDDIAI